MFGSLVRWLGIGAGSIQSDHGRAAPRARFTLGLEALDNREVPASLMGGEAMPVGMTWELPGIERNTGEEIPSPAPDEGVEIAGVRRGGEDMPAGQFTGGVEIAARPGGSGLEIRQGQSTSGMEIAGGSASGIEFRQGQFTGGMEIAGNKPRGSWEEIPQGAKGGGVLMNGIVIGEEIATITTFGRPGGAGLEI